MSIIMGWRMTGEEKMVKDKDNIKVKIYLTQSKKK